MRRAFFVVLALAGTTCAQRWSTTRDNVTLDCFGTPCETATGVCCALDGGFACVQSSSCTNDLECLSNSDCVEHEGTGSLVVHGKCCAQLTGGSNIGFSDAGTSLSIVGASCIFAETGACPAQSLPMCHDVDAACTAYNGSSPQKLCTGVSLGDMVMPFGVCK